MRILLAVDGSEPSEIAAQTVSTRPWPPGSVVRVLSVVSDAFPAVPEMAFAPDFQEMTRALTRDAEILVVRLVDALRHAGLTVDGEVRHGDPRSVIVEHAAEWKADLVVVGSHGRTGLQRWIMGSVAEQVVRHARCSVEVARALPAPVGDAARAGGSSQP